jgi:hypothetical protein
MDIDFTGMFVFMIIGLVAVALTLFVGLPWFVWWIFHHIAFV